MFYMGLGKHARIVLLSRGSISTDEIFKQVPIDGYQDYDISNYGKVFSRKSGKLLSPQHRKSGYVQFFFKHPGGKKNKGFFAHRLVAMAFIDNPFNKPEVNHCDADKANNHVDNLQWVTKEENTIHAMVNKLYRQWNKELPPRHEWRNIKGKCVAVEVI